MGLECPPAEAARDTGTAGPQPDAERLALCLARPGRKEATPVDSDRHHRGDMAEGESGETPQQMIETGPFSETGGEAGIRTQDQGLSPDNGLANRRFRPLSHLSAFGLTFAKTTTYNVYCAVVQDEEFMNGNQTTSCSGTSRQFRL